MLWTAVLGALVYLAYPYQVTKNTLAVSCPSTAVAPSLWTNSNCMNANPISQWTIVSYMLVITYGLDWLIWLSNMLFGNTQGSFFYNLFIYTSYAMLAAPLSVFGLGYLAYNSYGSAAQTLASGT